MITQPAPRTNIALIVSLCVNLLLAGVIATAAYRHFTQPPESPMAAGQPPGQQPPERAQLRQLLSPRFITHMAPEQEGQIRQIVDAHRQKLDALKAEANAGRRDVLTLFSAPVLDKDALAKAFARTQAADAAVETEVMHISAEIAQVLTPEQRKKAADWRGHHMMGGGPMGWHPGTGDGRDGNQPRPRDRD
jgi:uncharacterized membrane protein